MFVIGWLSCDYVLMFPFLTLAIMIIIVLYIISPKD
jgi:hypothetical protein